MTVPTPRDGRDELTAYQRFRRFGFPAEQAQALARAGYGLFFVPAASLLGDSQ